ncbi:hypothetical protein C8J57DRAFT_1211556 [Mycena rebaudengoi]|nr:hypothetical protein C8J57DRAFT_1211556 [Mycena rebaudengoi]
MNEITSQVLSMGLVTLTAFIPNDTLLYIGLVVASLAISAYLVHHSTPCAQLKKLEAYLKGTEALFGVVMKECASDPRFIAEEGLRLATAKLSVSVLRTRLMATDNIAWKEYPSYLKNLLFSIEECRKDVGQLQSSMLPFKGLETSTCLVCEHASGDEDGGEEEEEEGEKKLAQFRACRIPYEHAWKMFSNLDIPNMGF